MTLLRRTLMTSLVLAMAPGCSDDAGSVADGGTDELQALSADAGADPGGRTDDVFSADDDLGGGRQRCWHQTHRRYDPYGRHRA